MKYKDEVYEIIGAAMEVHGELGPGFLEAVYQEALLLELCGRGIPVEPQKQLAIYYKGQRLDKNYYADIVCYGKIIVELKALNDLPNSAMAQLLNYLKASGLQLGLLINFGAPSLQWKRIIL